MAIDCNNEVREYSLSVFRLAWNMSVMVVSNDSTSDLSLLASLVMMPGVIGDSFSVFRCCNA